MARSTGSPRTAATPGSPRSWPRIRLRTRRSFCSPTSSVSVWSLLKSKVTLESSALSHAFLTATHPRKHQYQQGSSLLGPGLGFVQWTPPSTRAILSNRDVLILPNAVYPCLNRSTTPTILQGLKSPQTSRLPHGQRCDAFAGSAAAAEREQPVRHGWRSAGAEQGSPLVPAKRGNRDQPVKDKGRIDPVAEEASTARTSSASTSPSISRLRCDAISTVG